ncbi:MAG: RNA polymerase subunit sigma-24 [Cytophaga sp.]|jgi:RNA polymerase sigma factor (sigma-70 family)|nr:RNA polymerase subunit sigma-24 [Cytophaga sp.]
MTDDRALVSRITSGDTQAFRLLIRQNERLVTHMVGRLIDRAEDREELCQDVFMKVYEKIGEFNFQSQLSTWVATIAYRHAINHLRKKKIQISDIPEEDQFTSHFISDDQADALAEQDSEEQVLKLIDKLPIQYKTVLTLYHLDGKNYTEIGEITGMPEGTVKNYLFRARHQLKESVKKHLGKEEWI